MTVAALFGGSVLVVSLMSDCCCRFDSFCEESAMAREIDWTDAEEIGIQLQEKFPEIVPYSVRFTDLHKYVTELPGFVGDPAKSNEGLLEAIQAAWNEEYEDAQ
jgi:FeS assembly protein IscX